MFAGGCLVATGCDGGNVALLELAEGLASAHRNDKTSVTAVCSTISIIITRKYPLRGYILGVLIHTTAWDRLWGGDGTLAMWF